MVSLESMGAHNTLPLPAQISLIVVFVLKSQEAESWSERVTPFVFKIDAISTCIMPFSSRLEMFVSGVQAHKEFREGMDSHNH